MADSPRARARAGATEQADAPAAAVSAPPTTAAAPDQVQQAVHHTFPTPDRSTDSPPAKPWEVPAAPMEATEQVDSPAATVSAPPAPATAPDLVQQAVGFLRHPNMRDAPADVKWRFMASKGLSPTQIDEAVQRAGLVHVPAVAAPDVHDQGAAGQRNAERPGFQWVRPAVAVGLAAAATLTVGRLLWSDAGAQSPPVPSPAARDDQSTATEGNAACCSAPEHRAAAAPRCTHDSCAGASLAEHDADLEASLAVLRGLTACAGRTTRPSSTSSSRLPAFRAALADACTRLREAPPSDGTAAQDAVVPPRGTAELIHALHTLTVVLNSMLLHPSSARFRRIAKANTNMRRLVHAVPDVLAALGFVASAGGGHWEWRESGAEARAEGVGGAVGGATVDEAIGEAELAELSNAKALLQRALAEATGNATMGALDAPADAGSAHDAARGTGGELMG